MKRGPAERAWPSDRPELAPGRGVPGEQVTVLPRAGTEILRPAGRHDDRAVGTERRVVDPIRDGP